MKPSSELQLRSLLPDFFRCKDSEHGSPVCPFSFLLERAVPFQAAKGSTRFPVEVTGSLGKNQVKGTTLASVALPPRLLAVGLLRLPATPSTSAF